MDNESFKSMTGIIHDRIKDLLEAAQDAGLKTKISKAGSVKTIRITVELTNLEESND